MTVREHWPPWYKDLYNADTERKRARLIEMVNEAHAMGIFDSQAISTAMERAKNSGDTQVFVDMIKMHKYLRGRK
jgi:hypothetical protein